MDVVALTREEWIARFIARMCAMAGFEKFADASAVADYAAEAAPTYWDNEDQRAEGPEACADSDISCWEPA